MCCRFNRKVTAVPAARKPIGNLERDCPPDKVTFKKAQRELYILTDGKVTATYTAKQLYAAGSWLHTSMIVVACRYATQVRHQ